MPPFINMAMLAGVAGAAVPAIIHLLNKSRYRLERWGAMLFLRSESSQRRRSIDLQQILLLVVRTLVIAAFTLALARPVLRRASLAAGLGGSRTAVILLDCSYSMGARRGAGDRFEEAKALALEVIKGLRRGDRAAVAFLGTGGRIECPEPDADLERVAAEIRDARLGHGRAAAVGGLAAAAERLAASETLGREIYLVTDSQRATWPGSPLAALGRVDFGELSRAAGALEEARFPPEAFLVEVTGEAENIAIQTIEIESPVLQAGRPMPVAVTVANYGRRARQTTLKLTADGEFVGARTVRLEAGQTEAVRFTHIFDDPGSHLLAAEVRPDALSADDRAALSVEVLDQMPVLLVNGDRRGEVLEGECGFLRRALEPVRYAGAAPQGSGPSRSVRRDLFKVREVTPSELASVDYSLYRTVALANVPVLREAEIRRLEEFVSEGGGLLIAPGDMVRPAGYNTVFWRGGDGLSPARLVEAAARGAEPEFPAPVPRGHPVFRFVTEGSAAPKICVRQRFSLEGLEPEMYAGEAKNGGARRAAAGRLRQGFVRPGVLMRTAGGEPLLAERPFGKGRVILSAIPLDDDWSDLPGTLFYVPFVWSTFGYLAGDAFPPRNVSVGEVLATWLDASVSEAVMCPPGREPVRAEVRRRGGRNSARYDDTREPGVYSLSYRRSRPAAAATDPQARSNGRSGPYGGAAPDEETVYFAVSVPRDESDLGPLSRAERREIEERLGTEFIDTRDELRRRVREVRTGSELWRPLILLAVALACFEVFVAARWRRTQAATKAG